MAKWYNIINATGPVAEILIYAEIGFFGVTAADFIADLNSISAPTINIRINSMGGETFEGFAIYNAIKRHPANTVTITDGIAASAASYPAIAGKQVQIAKNGYLMIHDPACLIFMGDSDDLRTQADQLDMLRNTIAQIYVDKTGKPLDQVLSWMSAATWFDSTAAKEYGFVDQIIGDTEGKPAAVENRLVYNLNYLDGRVPINERITSLGFPKAGTPAGNSVNSAGSANMDPITEPQVLEWLTKNPTRVNEILPIKNAVNAAVNAANTVHGTAQTAAVEAAKTTAYNSGVEKGKLEATPRNATPEEIKTAFAGDNDFIVNQIGKAHPINEHKAQYAEFLKTKVTNLQSTVDTLKTKLGEADPGSAGSSMVVNSGNPNAAEGAPGGADTNAPMNTAREQQLLNMTPLGQATLKQRAVNAH